MTGPPDRRRTFDYEHKLRRLDARRRLAVEMVEEGILVDPVGSYRRRETSGGAMVDLTAFDEAGLLVSYRVLESGVPEFIDFVFIDAQ